MLSIEHFRILASEEVCLFLTVNEILLEVTILSLIWHLNPYGIFIQINIFYASSFKKQE